MKREKRGLRGRRKRMERGKREMMERGRREMEDRTKLYSLQEGSLESAERWNEGCERKKLKQCALLMEYF